LHLPGLSLSLTFPSGNPCVVAAASRGKGAAQWVRSVHLHLLVLLPHASIRGVGRVRWRCEWTDVSPGVDADAETKRCGMRVGLARGSNAEWPVARDMRNRPEPSVGNRLRSAGKMVWRGGWGLVRTCARNMRQRRWVPCQRRGQGTPVNPLGGTGPGAPHNLARQRPHCERRGRSRRQYPTGRRWGADPGEMGVGTPSPL